MDHKIEGDKCLSAGNYAEYYQNYKKYHNVTQTQTSKEELNKAKKKYDLYKELCEFLKKEENKYYDILNLKQDATQKEIRDSYTKLIRKYHPDRTKMKESNSVSRILHKAYVILSNTKKRQEYDNSLKSTFSTQFNLREWNINQNNIFTNSSFMHDPNNFFWHHNNDEFTILNNILYRSFYRYTPNRRLVIHNLEDNFFLKLIILILLSYFILLV